MKSVCQLRVRQQFSTPTVHFNPWEALKNTDAQAPCGLINKHGWGWGLGSTWTFTFFKSLLPVPLRAPLPLLLPLGNSNVQAGVQNTYRSTASIWTDTAGLDSEQNSHGGNITHNGALWNSLKTRFLRHPFLNFISSHPIQVCSKKSFSSNSHSHAFLYSLSSGPACTASEAGQHLILAL